VARLATLRDCRSPIAYVYPIGCNTPIGRLVVLAVWCKRCWPLLPVGKQRLRVGKFSFFFVLGSLRNG